MKFQIPATRDDLAILNDKVVKLTEELSKAQHRNALLGNALTTLNNLAEATDNLYDTIENTEIEHTKEFDDALKRVGNLIEHYEIEGFGWL